MEIDVCGIMFNFDQGFSFGLASVGIVMAYFLYAMIIWYIKKKPLGTTTIFDTITIDTILIRLASLTVFFILFLTKVTIITIKSTLPPLTVGHHTSILHFCN